MTYCLSIKKRIFQLLKLLTKTSQKPPPKPQSPSKPTLNTNNTTTVTSQSMNTGNQPNTSMQNVPVLKGLFYTRKSRKFLPTLKPLQLSQTPKTLSERGLHICQTSLRSNMCQAAWIYLPNNTTTTTTSKTNQQHKEKAKAKSQKLLIKQKKFAATV